jgi:hypothetical protein
MFDDQNISDGGLCSGNYCPATPEQLDKLFGQDDELQPSDEDCISTAAAIAVAELEVLRSQITSCAETTQTLRYLEDRMISIGEQLDRLLDSSSSTELSAIAQSYTLLEQGKGAGLKLIEPETQSARAYFERQSRKPHSSIIECFLDLQKKLLIVVDSESHEITLAFAFRPTGKDFEPIKMLRLYEFSWLLKQFKPFEFRFGFGKICDLKAIAWAIALAYRELDYCCRIEICDALIDVDELIAEAEPSALWASIREVRLCA